MPASSPRIMPMGYTPPPAEGSASDWPSHLQDDEPTALSGCLGVVLGFAVIVAAMAILQARIAQEPIQMPREPVVRAEAEDHR